MIAKKQALIKPKWAVLATAILALTLLVFLGIVTNLRSGPEPSQLDYENLVKSLAVSIFDTGPIAKSTRALIEPSLVPMTASERRTAVVIAHDIGLELAMSPDKITVVDRRNLPRLTEEKRFGYEGDADSRTAARIGRMLGCNLAIFVTVAYAGDDVSILLEAVDIESGRMLGGSSTNICQPTLA